MRKIYTILFALVAQSVLCQLSPDKNYIKKSLYKMPIISGTESPYDDVVVSVDYIDGTGRLTQKSALRSGGGGEDVHKLFRYDPIGRQSKKYLPLAKMNDGAYISDVSEVKTFYNVAKYDYTQNPYEETEYDEVNLKSPKKVAHPGNDWNMLSDNLLREIITKNLDSDAVYGFTVLYDAENNPTFYIAGENPGNTLLKKIFKNENWKPSDFKNNTTEYYFDKFGRKCLRRTFLDGETQDTYYIYDNHDNLIFMLPPSMFENSTNFSQEELDKLGYQYRYDSKNRLVEKKLPGIDWKFIVYDKLNRPVLTQDGNQRNDDYDSYWSVTRYDMVGRVAYKGLMLDQNFTSRANMQQICDTWVTGEERVNVPTNINGTSLYYSNFSSLNFYVEAISYYDNYTFDPNLTNISNTNYYGNEISKYTKGYTTCTKFLVENTDQWETRIFLYDDKGRVLQTQYSSPYLATSSKIDFKLNYLGEILESKSEVLKSDAGINLITFDYYKYDHVGRLVKHSQKIGKNPTELIVFNKADEFGKIVEKKVGRGRFTVVSAGLSIVNGVYTKTASAGWGNGTLSSTTFLSKSGSFLFTTTNATNNIYVGVSYNPATTTYIQMNYSMFFSTATHLSGGKQVIIYESGINRGVKTNYNPSDEFSIERHSTALYYKKNGIVFYTSLVPAQGFLYADAHFNQNASSLSNLYIDNNEFEYAHGLQNTSYVYDVQGSLTKINNPNSLSDNLFGMEIRRNNAIENGISLFNGNVSQVYWKTANDNQLRHYDYTFDKLHRIKSATFYNTNNPAQNNSFSLQNVNYDKLGNITFLHRTGDVQGDQNLAWMDYINYTYDGSKLIKAKDEGHDYEGFRSFLTNGADQTNPHYKYDSNGNLINDANKGITSILYNNNLNLPSAIIFTGNKRIVFRYDSNGKKLSKTTTNGSQVVLTEYVEGMVFVKVNNGPKLIQYISTPEGYVGVNNGVYNYVYQYIDHLGSIRLSYTDKNNDGIALNNEIIEESNYYPFGMKHKGYNNVYNNFGNSFNKFGFEGQEMQEDFGLDWLQFKWRNYDPALGRFFNLDPLAEKYNWMTPYQFASNQPVHAPELEGLENWKDLSKDEEDRVTYGEYARDLHDSNGKQIHFPEYDIDEVVIEIESGIGDYDVDMSDYEEFLEGYDDQNSYIDDIMKGLEKMDDVRISGLGTAVKEISGPVGDALDLAKVGMGVYKDKGKFGDNARGAVNKVFLGFVGAELGLAAGFKFGLLIAPAAGPFAPVAIGVSSFIGAVVGGYIGGEVGDYVNGS